MYKGGILLQLEDCLQSIVSDKRQYHVRLPFKEDFYYSRKSIMNFY